MTPSRQRPAHRPFLVIPEVSSERREYVPLGWMEPPAIPSNKLRILTNATLCDFALLGIRPTRYDRGNPSSPPSSEYRARRTTAHYIHQGDSE